MIAKVDRTGGAFCNFARHAATMVVVPSGLSYNLHRWSMESRWETCGLVADFDWKKTTEPVMRLYTEATDGSFIERKKESAVVWHHDEADPDFGSCQAKELLDHLESMLANEPVVVKRGQHIVEVNPQNLREKVKNKEKYFDVSRMVEGRGNSLDVVKPLEL